MGEDITPKTQSLWIFQFDAWRRYWLNRRESHSHLHHICEEFRHLQAFWSWLFGCLSLLFLCWCCPRIQLIVSEFFFKIFMKRFKTAFLSNLKIPFISAVLAGQKSRVDLEVMESKIISNPSQQKTSQWGSHFCQYRHAVLWMIFLLLCKLPAVWMYHYKSGSLYCFFMYTIQQYGKCNPPPPSKGWWGPPTVTLLNRPLLSVAAPPMRKFLIPSLIIRVDTFMLQICFLFLQHFFW